MKTFCEVKMGARFDWVAAIQSMIDGKGTYSCVELRERANMWVTCACGNLCDIIPRKPVGSSSIGNIPNGGSPLDTILNNLGVGFYHRICGADWLGALAVLKNIEARSVVVIKETVELKLNKAMQAREVAYDAADADQAAAIEVADIAYYATVKELNDIMAQVTAPNQEETK